MWHFLRAVQVFATFGIIVEQKIDAVISVVSTGRRMQVSDSVMGVSYRRRVRAWERAD